MLTRRQGWPGAKGRRAYNRIGVVKFITQPESGPSVLAGNKKKLITM